jgi:hypothetical protein
MFIIDSMPLSRLINGVSGSFSSSIVEMSRSNRSDPVLVKCVFSVNLRFVFIRSNENGNFRDVAIRHFSSLSRLIDFVEARSVDW